MDKKITVTIDQMGNSTVEAFGFKGKGCTDATAAIEAALSSGGKVDRKTKDEYSLPGGETQQQIKQSW